jgi:hypothetical protein
LERPRKEKVLVRNDNVPGTAARVRYVSVREREANVESIGSRKMSVQHERAPPRETFDRVPEEHAPAIAPAALRLLVCLSTGLN